MLVYRITTTKWGETLTASGFPARWNYKDEFVLYTAQSVALAALENLVHLGETAFTSNFSLMSIKIPEELKTYHISENNLPPEWKEVDLFNQNHICKLIGSKWYKEQETLTLKVPSAIVPNDFNVLINTKHPHFDQLELVDSVPFQFDGRLLNLS